MQRKLWAAVRAWQDDPRAWYVPHAKQVAFHAAGKLARERLFLAGNRVGKTLAGAAEVGFHLTGSYPDWWDGVRWDRPVHAWAASVTREATRDILQGIYLGDGSRRGVIPKRCHVGVIHRSGLGNAADTVMVRHVSGGLSSLGFKSFDQGRASFQGTSREVIHLDEEPDVAVYEECLLRTLDVRGHVLLTMTPLLGLTEMVRHFVSSERAEGKAVVRAGWGDAPHLNASAVAALRASLRPHEREAREHGVPQLGRGRVLTVAEELVRCARFEIPPHWRRCVGIDFGWTNPTAAVWLAHDVATDTVYVTEVYACAEQPVGVHVAAIKRHGDIPTVGDPAGQSVNQRDGVSLLEVYEQSGLRIERANNDVEAGLLLMLERLRSGRLKVFADLAPWWAEYRSYMRDAKGKIVKRDDHLLDATRYALMSGLSIARASERVVMVRPPGNGWTV